ncbi:TPA: S8 family serine peptidase, partial [Candidatus Woesearchaeota archaeon]|nr:S8 family serine peptidase [Candidatus Woesearchaeota archaeon]
MNNKTELLIVIIIAAFAIVFMLFSTGALGDLTITGKAINICTPVSKDTDSSFFIKGTSTVSGCAAATVSDFCVSPCVVGEYVNSDLVYFNCTKGCVNGACLSSTDINPSLAAYCAERVTDTCTPTTEICNDGKDNDCDTKIDCQDTNCANNLRCIVQTCGDGDCDERNEDCETCPEDCGICPPVCDNTETLCNDGKDNDCDGSMDCSDDDCANKPSCNPYVVSGDDLDYKGYIIELKNPPLLEYKKNLEIYYANRISQSEITSQVVREETNAQILSELDTYREQLEIEHLTAKSEIQAELELSNTEFNEKIISEHKEAFNGISLDISDQEAESLKNSPSVKRIYPNYKVKAFLIDSVPLINADQVWDLTTGGTPCIEGGGIGECIKGKGINIAIIDTGVDYTHQDLGGCFGSSCKVKGGWDFVNDDGDPMDDHGHGTHVAATAAGRGILDGIAPEANIYAYKVLDSSGSGWSNDIISAIERAVDPNQDGDFSDHLDIISMSLGGWGNPNDPTSTAIDKAVDAGVVAVIAAGNSGPRENTITSPGTARKAITVAASGKQDFIPRFSSRGPVYWFYENGVINYLFKPDVTAPGVSICAAQSSQDTIWSILMDRYQYDTHCLDTKHIAISGTSMATPHVAGVAALLLQAHPDWNPIDIKNAIRGKAIQIDNDYMAQGYGRIDALKSIQSSKLPIAHLEPLKQDSGITQISGSAFSTNAITYKIYHGKGTSPDAFTEIYTSNILVINNYLYNNFNTTILTEGHNTIKLVVYDNQGGQSEDRIVPKAKYHPPLISFISPINDGTFTAGQPIVIDVSASDASGINNVVIKANGNILIIDTATPYYYVWLSAPVGSHVLVAVATDNAGATSYIVINITVNPANRAPNVSIIKPLNNSVFTMGNNIAINVSAYDPDGSVSYVAAEYSTNGSIWNYVGVGTLSPYYFVWNNIPQGRYIIRATATDNQNTKSYAYTNVVINKI